MINPGLLGKIALVTGANNPNGIGAAIARAFAAQGTAVFITYMRMPISPEFATLEANLPGEALYRQNNAKDAQDVIQSIRSAGGSAEAVEMNLADSANIRRLFDQVEQTFGAVDILVNNAAHSTADTFLPQKQDLANKGSVEWLSSGLPTLTAESHDQHFAINTRATALMMVEFAHRHVKRGATWGRIINLSTDGAHCFPSEIAYGASKLAIESYSRSAAVELGRFGITVNVISPGPIQTGWMTPQMEQNASRTNPIPRSGQPEDIADVAVFLASEQARWMTGQTLHVGGGHTV